MDHKIPYEETKVLDKSSPPPEIEKEEEEKDIL